MDERIKSAYQKIYSEFCTLIVLGAAASLLIKSLFFHAEPKALVTEFVILVGAPIYLWIRQTMLGLDPNAAANPHSKKAKKNYWLCLGCGLLAMTVVMSLMEGGLTPYVLINMLSFAVCFSTIYIASRSFAHWNAERKGKKYEDD